MDNLNALVWTPATTVPTVSLMSIQLDFKDNTQRLVEVGDDVSDLPLDLQHVVAVLFGEN